MILILKNDDQSCVRKYRCPNDQKIIWTSFLKLLLYTYFPYIFFELLIVITKRQGQKKESYSQGQNQSTKGKIRERSAICSVT